MDHYQDITILPAPEFPVTILMNALFAKFHRVLVKLQSTDIGVSFPNVNEEAKNLGDCLRLHSTEEALQNIQGENWLSCMRDHIEIQEIGPVPTNTQHRRVKRIQVKTNAERLRRRYRKRHEGVTEKDTVGLIPDSMEKRLTLPYLQLKSKSTGQRFHLFIEQQSIQSHPVLGEFNGYGLSNQATVPWF